MLNTLTRRRPTRSFQSDELSSSSLVPTCGKKTVSPVMTCVRLAFGPKAAARVRKTSNNSLLTDLSPAPAYDIEFDSFASHGRGTAAHSLGKAASSLISDQGWASGESLGEQGVGSEAESERAALLGNSYVSAQLASTYGCGRDWKPRRQTSVSSGEMEAIKSPPKAIFAPEKLTINTSVNCAQRHKDSIATGSSSSSSLAFPSSSFSRRPSASSDEPGPFASSPRRTRVPPPIKIPRLRGAGVAVDNHRTTASESDAVLWLAPRRADSLPGEDLVAGLNVKRRDMPEMVHRRRSLATLSAEDPECQERLSGINRYGETLKSNTAYKSAHSLLRPIPISRHARTQSGSPGLLDTSDSSRPGSSSTSSSYSQLSAVLHTAERVSKVPASEAVSVGEARSFKRGSTLHDPPHHAPNSNYRFPAPDSASLSEETLPDVPVTPRIRTMSGGTEAPSRHTSMHSIDIRTLPFGMTREDQRQPLLEIPKIALPQLPPVMSTLCSAISPVAPPQASALPSVSLPNLPQLPGATALQRRPASAASSEPPTGPHLQAGSADPENARNGKALPHIPSEHLRCEAPRNPKTRGQGPPCSVLAFARGPITPRLFPWRTEPLELAKRRCTSQELKAMADQALCDGDDSLAAEFVLYNAGALACELTECQKRGAELHDRFSAKHTKRDEVLKRHVMTLKAFNGEQGGRFAEKLAKTLSDCDRAVAELLGLVDHTNKVSHAAHAHWKAAALVKLDTLETERKEAMRKQLALEAELAQIKAERDEALAVSQHLRARLPNGTSGGSDGTQAATATPQLQSPFRLTTLSSPPRMTAATGVTQSTFPPRARARKTGLTVRPPLREPNAGRPNSQVDRDSGVLLRYPEEATRHQPEESPLSLNRSPEHLFACPRRAPSVPPRTVQDSPISLQAQQDSMRGLSSAFMSVSSSLRRRTSDSSTVSGRMSKASIRGRAASDITASRAAAMRHSGSDGFLALPWKHQKAVSFSPTGDDSGSLSSPGESPGPNTGDSIVSMLRDGRYGRATNLHSITLSDLDLSDMA